MSGLLEKFTEINSKIDKSTIALQSKIDNEIVFVTNEMISEGEKQGAEMVTIQNLLKQIETYILLIIGIRYDSKGNVKPPRSLESLEKSLESVSKNPSIMQSASELKQAIFNYNQAVNST